MIISIIAAVAANGVIGRKGTIPWDLPVDRVRFRELTLGHTLIMGRLTYESIGRPLPGRRTIVLSRHPGYAAAGCLVAPGLGAALTLCAGEPEVFICGGAALYREALLLADRIHLTLIHRDFDGDTLFPPIPAGFIETAREPVPGSLPATFLLLVR